MWISVIWSSWIKYSVVFMAKYVAKVSSKIICSYALFWRRKWQPTPGFLPGEFCGQRSLAGDSSWGHTEPEATEAAEHTRMHCSSAAPKPKPYFSVTCWSPSSSSVNRSSFQTEFWNLSQEIIILSMMIFLFMITFFFLVTSLKNTYYLKSYWKWFPLYK